MAIMCAVGDGLQRDPDVRQPPARGARRRADPDGVAGRGAAEHHAGDPRSRSRSGAAARARAVLRRGSAARTETMRVLLIGHGRMGRLVEQLAPEHGCEIVGMRDESSPIAAAIGERRLRRGRRGDRFLASADAVADESGARWPRVASTSSSARPDGRTTKPTAAQVVERAGIGVLASANFSIGMNIFRPRRRRGGARGSRRETTSAPGSTRRITPPRRTRRPARR